MPDNCHRSRLGETAKGESVPPEQATVNIARRTILAQDLSKFMACSPGIPFGPSDYTRDYTSRNLSYPPPVLLLCSAHRSETSRPLPSPARNPITHPYCASSNSARFLWLPRTSYVLSFRCSTRSRPTDGGSLDFQPRDGGYDLAQWHQSLTLPHRRRSG